MNQDFNIICFVFTLCYLESWTGLLMPDIGTCPTVGYVQIFNFTPKMKCLSVIPMSEHQGSDTGTWINMKSPSNIAFTSVNPLKELETIFNVNVCPEYNFNLSSSIIYPHILEIPACSITIVLDCRLSGGSHLYFLFMQRLSSSCFSNIISSPCLVM